MSILFRGAVAALVVFTGVATVRADAKDDVRKSAKALAEAMSKGDYAEAQKHVLKDEKTDPFLEAIVKMSAASTRLDDAAKSKFGADAGSLMGPRRPGAMEFRKQLDGADIQVDGDTATLKSKDARQPVQFKKADGDWKLDLAALPNAEQMARTAPMMGKLATAMDETADDIKADKYKTIDEARRGLQQKMAAAFGGARPGAGGAPGGRPNRNPGDSDNGK